MASQLGIQAGALSSVKQYTNDTKVQETLLKFYVAASLGPLTASNQEKLDAVVEWIETQIISAARNYELNERRAALVDDVETEIGLE